MIAVLLLVCRKSVITYCSAGMRSYAHALGLSSWAGSKRERRRTNLFVYVCYCRRKTAVICRCLGNFRVGSHQALSTQPGRNRKSKRRNGEHSWSQKWHRSSVNVA